MPERKSTWKNLSCVLSNEPHNNNSSCRMRFLAQPCQLPPPPRDSGADAGGGATLDMENPLPSSVVITFISHEKLFCTFDSGIAAPTKSWLTSRIERKYHTIYRNSGASGWQTDIRSGGMVIDPPNWRSGDQTEETLWQADNFTCRVVRCLSLNLFSTYLKTSDVLPTAPSPNRTTLNEWLRARPESAMALFTKLSNIELVR